MQSTSCSMRARLRSCKMSRVHWLILTVAIFLVAAKLLQL